jgi:hypothetical protein
VLTFHADTAQLPGLTEALDIASVRLAKHPAFRGLICLDNHSVRQQMIVITMWDGDGLADTQAESELAQQEIAAITGLGVSNTPYDVLRLVPASVLDGSSLTGALAY